MREADGKKERERERGGGGGGRVERFIELNILTTLEIRTEKQTLERQTGRNGRQIKEKLKLRAETETESA